MKTMIQHKRETNPNAEESVSRSDVNACSNVKDMLKAELVDGETRENKIKSMRF